MKKRVKRINKFQLGDLIAALFEETKKITSDHTEQQLLVYAALKDLLRHGIHTHRPIALA